MRRRSPLRTPSRAIGRRTPIGGPTCMSVLSRSSGAVAVRLGCPTIHAVRAARPRLVARVQRVRTGEPARGELPGAFGTTARRRRARVARTHSTEASGRTLRVNIAAHDAMPATAPASSTTAGLGSVSAPRAQGATCAAATEDAADEVGVDDADRSDELVAEHWVGSWAGGGSRPGPGRS